MSYYRLFLSVFLFGIFVLNVRAQPLQIEGQVLDASSRSPLSSTNVIIAGTSRGTATNEKGQFVLPVDSLPIRLVVSHIGYQRITREVNEGKSDSVLVQLEPKRVAMEEIIIEGRTAEFFVKSALEKLNDLSSVKTKYTDGVRGFYRQKTGFYTSKTNSGKRVKVEADTVYTEYMESFYNVFTSPFGVRGWSIDQARYARAEKPKYRLYFTNFSTLTSKWFQVPPYKSLEDANIIQPLHKGARRYFTFETIGHVKVDNRNIVKIKYKPKEELEKAAFSGTLFIDSETYALYRYEGVVRSSEPLLFEVEGEMRDVTFRMSAFFRKRDKSNVTVLDQVKFNMLYDHVVAGIRRRYNTTSTFFVYNYDPEETFGTSRTKNDYAAIDSVEYDPEFWRDNPVLARTPSDKAVIRSFEKTGGFGRFVEERIGSE